MIDTLRLTVPSSCFYEPALEMLLRLQSKIQRTNYSGDRVDWSILSGVALPSWAEGFQLVVGDRVTVEASPKIYQGHNIDGPDDLLTAASNILNFIFGDIFRLESCMWPRPGRWYVSRVDVAYQHLFDSFEALDMWMDTVAGVQRGQRRAGVELASPDYDGRDFSVDAMPSGRTLYIGKGSRLRVGKIYAKGRDFRKHPPRCLKFDPETVAAIAQELDPVARFELQLRARSISRNAVKFGIVPAHFGSLGPTEYADNVAKELKKSGYLVLHSVNKKDPITYFPVELLDKKLDLKSLWEQEFSHFFARESAMDDAKLFRVIFDIAPSPKQAQAALNFLMLIRTQGFAYARSTVSKSAYYRHRSLLLAAGLSDAVLQDGAPLVRVPIDPVVVRDFRASRTFARSLGFIEQAHKASLPLVLERLRSEFFKVAA